MRFFISIAFITCVTLAQAGIIRQDVRGLSKSGSTKLIGDVTLSEGSNISLTQVGQNITISATGGSITSTAWALVGNSGTDVSTNFIGTTDAVDFISKTNNTERYRLSSTGQFLFNNSTATSGFHVKSLNTGLDGGLVLEGNSADASRNWDFFVRPADSTLFVYNPNAGNTLLSMQSNGLVGTGNQSPDYHFDVNGDLSSTTPATLAINTKGPTLTLRNSDNTINDYSALIFQGASGNHQWDSLIAGVHETHTNTPTGHLSFFTNNAGTIAERAKITSAGLVMDGNAISSVLDPVSAQDAATKNYVDLQRPVAGVGLSYAGSVLNINNPITVTIGGTGQSSLTSNNVILGNGTSPVQFVAPGTSGNVLTSNGTTWTSSTPATSSGSDSENFIMNGGVSVLDDFDAIRRVESNKTLQKIVACEYNSGTSDYTSVKVNYGPTLSLNTSITIPATSGVTCTSTSPAIALSTNDFMNMDVTRAAAGAQDLSVKLIFQ